MPVSSDTIIGNLALAAIGTRSQIQSLNEGSNESNVLSLHYDSVRDEILRAVHWNFARMQMNAALLIDGTQPNQTRYPPQPWLYEYALPSDCVQARYILPMFDAVPGTVPGTVSVAAFQTAPVRFLVTGDNDANGNAIECLLTNQANAILVYTRRITNPALFDSLFTQAFAQLLGSRVAMQLTGELAKVKSAFEIANDTITRARAANGNEGLSIVQSIPDWIKVRGYASDFAYPDGGMWLYGPNSLSMVV